MNKVLGILAIAGISIIYLFVACACVLSGKISEEERKNDRKSK